MDYSITIIIAIFMLVTLFLLIIVSSSKSSSPFHPILRPERFSTNNNYQNQDNQSLYEAPRSEFVDSAQIYDLLYAIYNYAGQDPRLTLFRQRMNDIGMQYKINNQKFDLWKVYNLNPQVKKEFDQILKQIGKDVTRTHFVETNCTANQYIPHVDRWYYDPDISDIDLMAVEKRWIDAPEDPDDNHWGTKWKPTLTGALTSDSSVRSTRNPSGFSLNSSRY